MVQSSKILLYIYIHYCSRFIVGRLYLFKNNRNLNHIASDPIILTITNNTDDIATCESLQLVSTNKYHSHYHLNFGRDCLTPSTTDTTFPTANLRHHHKPSSQVPLGPIRHHGIAVSEEKREEHVVPETDLWRVCPPLPRLLRVPLRLRLSVLLVASRFVCRSFCRVRLGGGFGGADAIGLLLEMPNRDSRGLEGCVRKTNFLTHFACSLLKWKRGRHAGHAMKLDDCSFFLAKWQMYNSTD